MIAIPLPPEAVEEIAERAAQLVLERLAAQRDNTGPSWLHGAQAVAEYTGLPRSTVFKLVGRGEIPCSRIGSRLLFDRRELDDWLRSEREHRP